MHLNARHTAGLLLAAMVAAAPASADDGSNSYALATPHPEATAVGEEILASGGSAYDAAVAISATLAVVEPYGFGLGGGGFWLLEDGSSGEAVMIDGRERAPLAATTDMFFEADERASLDGALAAAVPGAPAALDHLASEYAERSRRDLLAPAIELARDGFAIDERYHGMAEFRRDVMREGGAGESLLDAGSVPEVGDTLRQPALADTLERFARHGRSGFYDGPIAARLVAGVRAAGGIWSRRDLRAYEVIEREPISAAVDGLEITSAPPPSSGGIALVQMLQILEAIDFEPVTAAGRIHTVVEAMRRAYRDRARFLGDSDFVAVPSERLTDASYNDRLAATIMRDRASPSPLPPGAEQGGANTTHFSVVDSDGNRVAATLSLNYPFGSGVMPAGTGVVLNNHMNDFTVRPGEPNAYGLIQGRANRIEPGKRMLSSMSPTLLEQADGRSAVLGTPGGSRIITTVLLAALDFADGASAHEMVSAPRYHHQYLPDRIQYEPHGLPATLVGALSRRGHAVYEYDRQWGNSQIVVSDPVAGFAAAADPRGIGSAVANGRVGSR